MSSSGTLYSDWLQPGQWEKILASSCLHHCCSFPQTAPACHCSQQSSAWVCWTCSLGECCCTGWKNQCHCHLTLPCSEGRDLDQWCRHFHGRLQLLHQTSVHRCGCWRHCWTECCCWSGWSTESHPAEEMITFRQTGT